MADFKTHARIGAFTAFGLTIFTYIMGWVGNFAISILIFFTAITGSILPDMDSDTGLPIQIIFGFYSYFAAGMAFYFIYKNGFHFAYAIVAPVLAYAFVQYAFQPWFKKQTKHRGIFHSTPAVLISFFLTLFIVDFFKINILEKLSFSLALCLGYFTHLLLDELYSTSIFEGKLKIKRSFGTALDLGFNDTKTAVFSYLLLFLLIFLTWPILKDLQSAIF